MADDSAHDNSVLDDQEREIAQDLIDAREPGNYELREIFGDFWDTVTQPNSYGKRFKKSVLYGHLSRISWKGPDSQNHQIYLIG